MTTSHETLIRHFYESFAAQDYPGMAECYHPDVHFSDAVYPDLKGARARAMWQMFCETPGQRTITFRDVRADDNTGSAHWEAIYNFSRTGRHVHNRIDASFRFRDGKIIDHHDTFSFWRWAAQALGPTGLLLGWTPMIQKSVQRAAAENLEKFIASRKLDMAVR